MMTETKSKTWNFKEEAAAGGRRKKRNIRCSTTAMITSLNFENLAKIMR